jgi:hypothetical protein
MANQTAEASHSMPDAAAVSEAPPGSTVNLGDLLKGVKYDDEAMF